MRSRKADVTQAKVRVREGQGERVGGRRSRTRRVSSRASSFSRATASMPSEKSAPTTVAVRVDLGQLEREVAGAGGQVERRARRARRWSARAAARRHAWCMPSVMSPFIRS